MSPPLSPLDSHQGMMTLLTHMHSPIWWTVFWVKLLIPGKCAPRFIKWVLKWAFQTSKQFKPIWTARGWIFCSMSLISPLFPSLRPQFTHVFPTMQRFCISHSDSTWKTRMNCSGFTPKKIRWNWKTGIKQKNIFSCVQIAAETGKQELCSSWMLRVRVSVECSLFGTLLSSLQVLDWHAVLQIRCWHLWFFLLIYLFLFFALLCMRSNCRTPDPRRFWVCLRLKSWLHAWNVLRQKRSYETFQLWSDVAEWCVYVFVCFATGKERK